MTALLTRILAVLLALQPWALGAFAAPRSKNNSTSSLSSPARDQTSLENAKPSSQLPTSAREAAVAATSTYLPKTPNYSVISSSFRTAPEAIKIGILAWYSRWLE